MGRAADPAGPPRRQELDSTMTLNVLRGRGAARRPTREAMPEPLPIGDDDSEIFNCPTCTRPLAVGARRCPGCRTRLLLGVQLTRAAAFVGLGLSIGVALTSAFVVASLNLGVAQRPADEVRALPAATAATGPAPVASVAPVPSAAPVGPAIPGASLTALTRTAEMNARIAAAIPVLEAQLAAGSVDAVAVAEVFRAMNADAAYAAGIVTRLPAWAEAAALASGLEAFYADIRVTARDGLSKSLGSEAAYRSAAERMLAVLSVLGPLDAASRDLAASAGIELPAVPVPTTTGRGDGGGDGDSTERANPAP